MKILEIIESLAPGGAQRFVVDLSNELVKDQKNKVYLCTFRNNGNNAEFYTKSLNPNIIRLKYKGNWTFYSKLKQFLFVMKIIKEVSPDVVHAHTLAFTYIILPSIIYKDIKFFYTVHNVAEKDTASGLSSFLRKKFLKKRIKAVTISSFCAKSFYKYYGFNSFVTIENGCRDIHTSNRLSSVKTEINNYRKTKSSKVFINVARISPQKNHELLIKAFNELIKKQYDAILLIIGDYKIYYSIKNNLDKLVKNDRIFFLGTRNNVSDYLYCSDFFCLSSLYEGLPISLLEAGMMGCYPISTAVGGVPDVIINSSWGALSRDMKVSSYLEVLEQVYKENIDRTKLKKLYWSKFSMISCSEKYIKLFEQ